MKTDPYGISSSSAIPLPKIERYFTYCPHQSLRMCTAKAVQILQAIDINRFNFTPLLATIATYRLARHVLPPFEPSLAPQPGQEFTLQGVLAPCRVLPGPVVFHNAGNDAVYALYAMICLVARHENSRAAELSPGQKRRLETLTQITLPDRAY